MGVFGVSDTGDSLQADDGTIILYHGEAERKIARQTIEDHLEKLETSIRARRKDNLPLTPTEARKGLYRKPQTEQEKLHAELTWQSMVAEPKAKGTDSLAVNPHARRLAEYEREQRKAEDPKKFQIEEDVRLWEEKQAEQKRQDELRNDPHRIASLAIAVKARNEARYNEKIPASTLDTLERLVDYIRSGGDLEKARTIQYDLGQQVIADLEVQYNHTKTQMGENLAQQKVLRENFNLPEPVLGTVVIPTETNS
jgi:hypothetical protein